jgi:hypothetical protein
MLFYWNCHSTVWVVRSWQCNSLELDSNDILRRNGGIKCVGSLGVAWNKVKLEGKEEMKAKELCS